MIEKLIEICKEKQPLYIQPHDFPDADAIGTAFGLQYILMQYGIASEIIYVGNINRKSTRKVLQMFDIQMRQIDGCMEDTDHIICVDSQYGLGNNTQKAGDVFACIDHHPDMKTKEYEYSHVTVAGACVSLLVEEMIGLGLDIPKKLATIFLYALKIDTAEFSRGVTPLDLDVFKYLFGRANQDKVYSLMNNNLELEDMKALGEAIKNIRVVMDIGVTYVPFDCPNELVAILSDFMLGIDELNFTIVFSKQKDGVRVSARSILPFISAGELIRRALKDVGSGGGHAMFAGGFIPNSGIEKLRNEDGSENSATKILDKRIWKAYHELLDESAKDELNEEED